MNAAIVPITVRYLGPEKYGLWITITTTVTMAIVFDIGIASTLTNLISSAYARDDRNSASQYFTTAFWSLIIVGICIFTTAATVWPHIPWQAIFHISQSALVPELSSAFAVACLIFLIGIPASLAGRIMAGYQELYIYNLFAGFGSLLSLVGVCVATSLQANLVLLVSAFSAGPVIANASCLAWICISHKPWMAPLPEKFSRAHLSEVFQSGGQFFIVQVAGVVVFNSDNIVISHYLSPSEVTPYSVTWRLATYGTYILALVTPALWPAYAEAFATGDFDWIRKTYRNVQRASLATLLIGAMILAHFGKVLITLWAGPAGVPSTALLNWMCVWMVVYGATVNQACLMGATGRIGRQAMIAPISALANLALSVYLVGVLGQVGVILGSIASYVLFVVLFQSLEVRKILQEGQRRETVSKF